TIAAVPASSQDSPQRKGKFGPGGPNMPKSQITPHWFADDSRFWYRNDLKGGAREFILVDCESGRREPAFDHAKLAAALSAAAKSDFKADRLPFDAIEFADAEKVLKFDAAGKAWTCDLSSYECTPSGPASKRPAAKELEPAGDDPGSPEFGEQQPEQRQP